MLNNYRYFIVLAEEQNISKAAQRLFISHQCLSKYLKNLETEYHVSFFERSPKLSLTPAGQIYLDTVCKIQQLESDLEDQMEDIRQSKRGVIRLGTTEGRYRILVPDLLAQFKMIYPDVTLDVQYDPDSRQLSALVLENKLDMVLLNKRDLDHNQLELQPLLEEQLYLVVSDDMLQDYFPQRYPQCKQELMEGVDLAHFQKMPFVLSKPGLNSREVLEKHLQNRSLNLNCVMELSQLDLHFMITARNYAASFCWSMFIPMIRQMNQSQNLSHLNVFPVKGRGLTNSFMLATRKGKQFPAYGRDLIRQIKRECSLFSRQDIKTV